MTLQTAPLPLLLPLSSFFSVYHYSCWSYVCYVHSCLGLDYDIIITLPYNSYTDTLMFDITVVTVIMYIFFTDYNKRT